MSSRVIDFIGVPCTKQAPTKRHRPAVWECMLGTVYAMNDEGFVRYFDYDHDAALAYAGINAQDTAGLAPRLHKHDGQYSYSKNAIEPSKGKLVLWVLKTPVAA